MHKLQLAVFYIVIVVLISIHKESLKHVDTQVYISHDCQC